MNIVEQNAKRNQFAKEVTHIIGSPYRIHEYCNYRLKGKSKEEALLLVKKKNITGR